MTKQNNNETVVVTNVIPVKELRPGFYVFGNKGSLWSNKAHIARQGNSTTMCLTPMLGSNHCSMSEEIGCEDCIREYQKEIKL